MRGKGITYDTGFLHAGVSTREPFDPEVVRREMDVIRHELHCTAVRVTGGDPGRLEVAARHAADAGLEVWFSPFTSDLTTGELLAVLADCADRAERLRREGAEVVLVTGAELSLFTRGFLPGDTLDDRLALLAEPVRVREAMAAVPARLNAFLGEAVEVVRARFGGRVTYAALPSERVDWTPFDIVAADLYNSAEIADRYAEAVRSLVTQGKPVAITEFGCTTHRGAAALGAHGMSMIEWDPHGRAVGLRDEYVRDEREQVAYLRDSLATFAAEGVDTAFWNTFASYHLPHRTDGADLDLASYGVVKVFEDGSGGRPGLRWEPKAAFAALAEAYRDGVAVTPRP